LTMLRHWLRSVLAKPARRKCPSAYRVRPVLEILEDRLTPSTLNWNLYADGDFDSAANWDVQGTNPVQHRVPGPGDDAMISTPPAINVRLRAGDNITVHTLVSNEHLQIDGGATLTIAAGNANGIAGIMLADGGALHVANTNTFLKIS